MINLVPDLQCGKSSMKIDYPKTCSPSQTFELSNNGDLVLCDSTRGVVVWASKTSNSSVAEAVLQDDGNLVLLNTNKDIVWQSFGHFRTFITPVVIFENILHIKGPSSLLEIDVPAFLTLPPVGTTPEAICTTVSTCRRRRIRMDSGHRHRLNPQRRSSPEKDSHSVIDRLNPTEINRKLHIHLARSRWVCRKMFSLLGCGGVVDLVILRGPREVRLANSVDLVILRGPRESLVIMMNDVDSDMLLEQFTLIWLDLMTPRVQKRLKKGPLVCKRFSKRIPGVIKVRKGPVVLQSVNHRDLLCNFVPSDTLVPGQNLSSSQVLRAASRNSVSSFYSLRIGVIGDLELKWENDVVYWRSTTRPNQSDLRAVFASNGRPNQSDLRAVIPNLSRSKLANPSQDTTIEYPDSAICVSCVIIVGGVTIFVFIVIHVGLTARRSKPANPSQDTTRAFSGDDPNPSGFLLMTYIGYVLPGKLIHERERER
ncbi:hypothetical protein LXL04_024722 [Taraxacum kok-saghyz]